MNVWDLIAIAVYGWGFGVWSTCAVREHATGDDSRWISTGVSVIYLAIVIIAIAAIA